MIITGRITKDAVINSLKDERQVVNFSIAINDSYKPKGGERMKVTTYCNCSYWRSEKVAELLKKGALVEVSGRIYVTAYAGTDGTAKASLNCHVNHINILAWPKEAEGIGKAVPASSSKEDADEVPF